MKTKAQWFGGRTTKDDDGIGIVLFCAVYLSHVPHPLLNGLLGSLLYNIIPKFLPSVSI